MEQVRTLDSRIAALFPDMSHSQKELARFILDNGLFVAFAPAAELGGKVGVSAATVVRFCQILGYDGYPELQKAVRENLPTYVNKVQRMEQGETLEKDRLIERVFGLDIENLTRTRELLESTRFWAAVKALGKARQILVVGGGSSTGPAYYLAHSLRVMGLDARCVVGGGIPLALELVRLEPASVLVGISVWRYVAETAHAMEEAERRGATRIAITDSIVSPIAQRADYAFQVGTDGAAHALSLTSSMSLINAIIAAISLERPQETSRALQQVDAAYRAGKLLAME